MKGNCVITILEPGMCEQGWLCPVGLKVLASGPPRGFRGPGAKLQNVAPCVFDRSKQKGREVRESGKQNLEALLKACRLLLLGVSLNTSKEVINKNFDIS